MEYFQTNANILSTEKNTIYYMEKYRKKNSLLSYTLNIFHLLYMFSFKLKLAKIILHM